MLETFFSSLLELVERLILQDGEGFSCVRDCQDHDRTFPLAGWSTITAFNIDASLGQKIRYFLQSPRLVFEAQQQGSFLHKADFRCFQCRTGSFQIRNQQSQLSSPCNLRSGKGFDIDLRLTEDSCHLSYDAWPAQLPNNQLCRRRHGNYSEAWDGPRGEQTSVRAPYIDRSQTYIRIY